MLTLECPVSETIVDHARAGRPHEVCGILGGDHGTDASHASAVEPTENIAEQPRTEYEIAPQEQFDAMEAIEARGDDIVGFYHSHPAAPPGPSTTDAAQATWPDYSYVIVSFERTDAAVGSWRWTGEEFVEETVEIKSDEF